MYNNNDDLIKIQEHIIGHYIGSNYYYKLINKDDYINNFLLCIENKLPNIKLYSVTKLFNNL